MADVHTKEQRSYNMSRIRSSETTPEIIVRKYLFSKGLRYRKNDKRLPGKPDIVLPKYKTIVFVHGCFWHQHQGCRYAVIPSTNHEFWIDKLTGNQKRDNAILDKLESDGWRVLIVWECQLKDPVQNETLSNLYRKIIHGS